MGFGAEVERERRRTVREAQRSRPDAIDYGRPVAVEQPVGRFIECQREVATAGSRITSHTDVPSLAVVTATLPTRRVGVPDKEHLPRARIHFDPHALAGHFGVAPVAG